MENNSQLAELLRNRNLKATSTRLEVLSVMASYNKAIAFSEIQSAISGYDRVTLYRTIQSLTDSGIIHKALVEEKETFYAMCSSTCTTETHNHKHIHFKCSSCLAVTCVQSDGPIQVSIPGHLITNFEIEATGICQSCA